MGRQVVVIASGETERRSLPYLVAHLQAEDVFVAEVRIPPGNKMLCGHSVRKFTIQTMPQCSERVDTLRCGSYLACRFREWPG